MPALTPCSRRDFVRRLKKLGYEGPLPGGKHEYMAKPGAPTIRVPNPHRGDISIDLLKRILRIARITIDEWSDG